MDEVGYSGSLIGVNPHKVASGVEPAGLGAFHVRARGPALVRAPRRPQTAEPRFGTKCVSERCLESGVLELGVRLAKHAHEGLVVPTFDDAYNEFRRHLRRLSRRSPAGCDPRPNAAIPYVARHGCVTRMSYVIRLTPV